jgi:hypothetical protein
MEDREWMYTGHVGRNDVTPRWIRENDDFVERTYGEAVEGVSLVSCPCSKCANQKRKIKEGHGRTYLEEWIYAGQYSVDLPW